MNKQTRTFKFRPSFRGTLGAAIFVTVAVPANADRATAQRIVSDARRVAESRVSEIGDGLIRFA